MKEYKIIEKKNLWFLLSILVIIAGFSTMFLRSLNSEPILNFGIDFKGGTSIIIKSEELNNTHSASNNKEELRSQFIEKLRNTLKENGLEKSTIQISSELEVIIKTLQLKEDKSQNLLDALRNEHGNIEVLEIDFIGPTIGKELTEKSSLIIIFIVIFLLIYISWRFEWKYGVSAIAALVHDGLVTISLSALLNIEINTAFVAALLTILGYSINDTIVIFDRIRENQIKWHDQEELSFPSLTNISLTQTLYRTINTSTTTLLVISSLIIFGGPTITGFCYVLLIGVLSGTYSSLFIASPLVVLLNKTK